MIEISKNPTADSRTCDVTKVSKGQLLAASVAHINDVRKGLDFFMAQVCAAGQRHDPDKLDDIDGFYANFQTKFTERDWLDRHYEKNRHHLDEATGRRDDMDLIDVLDYIADNVMAGMARSGEVRQMPITPELLRLAFDNTVAKLTAQVAVKDGPMSMNEFQKKEGDEWVPAHGAESVRVGDHFRFSAEAMKFIVNEPDASTVVVQCAEIQVEADGCKRIICTPV